MNKATKFLTGQEASILALFAQSPQLSEEQRDELLNNLKGVALKIGRAMFGLDKKPSKRIKKSADEFFAWAKTLGYK
jgi:hypothetical protein